MRVFALAEMHETEEERLFVHKSPLLLRNLHAHTHARTHTHTHTHTHSHRERGREIQGHRDIEGQRGIERDRETERNRERERQRGRERACLPVRVRVVQMKAPLMWPHM